jgi:hypothetical protein
LTVAAEGIGINFRITSLASPMRPLIATQIGKTRELGNKQRSEINSAFDNRNPLYKAVAALGEYRLWIIVGVAKRGAKLPYHLMNLVCVFLEKSFVHQVSYRRRGHWFRLILNGMI